MEELIEKVENLKNSIDNTEEIKKLNILNEEIMKDKELLEKIKRYNETQDENIKKEIISNSLFQEYKHAETDCNLLIMGINQKLKKQFGKDKGCL